MTEHAAAQQQQEPQHANGTPIDTTEAAADPKPPKRPRTVTEQLRDLYAAKKAGIEKREQRRRRLASELTDLDTKLAVDRGELERIRRTLPDGEDIEPTSAQAAQ